MSAPLTGKIEKALTRLGLWGAMRTFFPITVALLGSVLLLESLAGSASRLFPLAPANVIHAVAIGTGLLLGLFGHFAGDLWDRFFFEAGYGPRGRWLDTTSRPLSLFPEGAALRKVRSQAAQALKTEIDDGFYRQAVKLARRQAERWELVEHPLILSWTVRGLLGPCLVAAVLAGAAAAAALLLGVVDEIVRPLAIGGAGLLLGVLLLNFYAGNRMEHMLRLYQDVALHHGKRKS